MNLKLYLLFISIFLSISLFSQDQKAVEIIKEFEEKNKAFKNIHLDFNINIQNKEEHQKQNGKLIIEQNKFILDMEQQLTICDGETEWVYLKKINEVQIMKYKPKNHIVDPNFLFQIHKKGNSYKYIESTSVEKKHTHVIDIENKWTMPSSRIRLEINRTSFQLKSLSFYDKNDISYNYKIISFSTNITSPNFSFNTEEYPNIEIIDLR